jgi:hypothetical protein|tara:strand:+ start:667 stop:1260 length:594 start_codon:yes stop_codon:yes gene_type:complete
MKKKIYIIITLTVLTALSFGMTSSTKDVPIDIPTKVELGQIQRINQQAIIDSINQYHQIELDEFLHAIGHRESTNRYDVVNKWGYMGKYQFGRSTLRGLGYEVSKKEFLSNPDLQEEAMLSLLTHNKEKLQEYIDIFDGKTINGIYITESGILAAAHLGGQGSVKRYFRNGKVFRDGNGTKITSYMNKFSGYDIALN